MIDVMQEMAGGVVGKDMRYRNSCKEIGFPASLALGFLTFAKEMGILGMLVGDIQKSRWVVLLRLVAQYIVGGEWKGKKIEEAARNCH